MILILISKICNIFFSNFQEIFRENLKYYVKYVIILSILIVISVISQYLQMQGGLFMKRKFEIPKMSTEEIAHWYATIKPIVNHDTYLRKLSTKELQTVAYIWLN